MVYALAEVIGFLASTSMWVLGRGGYKGLSGLFCLNFKKGVDGISSDIYYAPHLEERREALRCNELLNKIGQCQAPVAQWIEHSPSKRAVAGSTPAGRASKV